MSFCIQVEVDGRSHLAATAATTSSRSVPVLRMTRDLDCHTSVVFFASIGEEDDRGQIPFSAQ